MKNSGARKLFRPYKSFWWWADERANLERVRFFFFSKRGRAAEVTVAADDDDEYGDGDSTATGAPPLEPEAGDWDNAADLKKKTGRKPEEDAMAALARLCAASRPAARPSPPPGARPSPCASSSMKNLPRHCEDRGFSHRSASFSPFMLSRYAAVLVQDAGSPRRHRRPPPCAVLLAPSRDPALLLPALTLVNLFSSDTAVPESGAPPRRDAREEAALSATVGPSHRLHCGNDSSFLCYRSTATATAAATATTTNNNIVF
jgi:hypothetical protein